MKEKFLYFKKYDTARTVGSKIVRERESRAHGF
jgi:hypothetical protein